MMDKLQRIFAGLMNRVRVNRLQAGVHEGVPVFVKRRRVGGSVVIWFGNIFLGLADSGMGMIVARREWAEWEVFCVRLLYPERAVALMGPGAAVIVSKIGGVSLRQWLQRGEQCHGAFRAAAREIRRVHQLPCQYYRGTWSHGDLHLDNILYDEVTDRAELIDFDTRHQVQRSARWRQADDLKTMLLELIGRSEGQWQSPAIVLLETYGVALVLNELSRQLVVPRGLAKVLWHTKTHGVSTLLLAQRITELRTMIQRVVATSCHEPGG